MIREVGFGPRLIREYNELNILRFIKNEGPISRADLAKRYKISKAAVSEIINDLLRLGYVREIGTGNSTVLGGRKPILLEFNPKAGYVIGIEIKRDHGTIALGDLNANLRKTEVVAYDSGASLKSILERIYEVIDDFKETRWVKNAKPVGIGVAIPGLIDYREGKIRESDSLKGWQGFPLRESFEMRYGIDTLIENDVKTITLGECRFGNGKNIDNMVYLWMGDGLGAGIIINGELYRGVSASAGEVGYFEPGNFIQNTDEFSLLYDKQKYFGELLSESIIVDAALRGIREGYDTEMEVQQLDVEKVLHFAENDDPLAVEILRQYGQLAGMVCTNLVNTLNPELILIGGHYLSQSKVLLRIIREKVRHAILRTPSKAVQIKSAALRGNVGILGAFALILEDLFFMDRLNVTRYRDVFGNKRV